jgi:hypothetical protein
MATIMIRRPETGREILNRGLVISFIGRQAKQLATLASEQGCTSLSYLLQTAVQQAERDLAQTRDNGGRA